MGQINVWIYLYLWVIFQKLKINIFSGKLCFVGRNEFQLEQRQKFIFKKNCKDFSNRINMMFFN